MNGHGPHVLLVLDWWDVSWHPKGWPFFKGSEVIMNTTALVRSHTYIPTYTRYTNATWSIAVLSLDYVIRSKRNQTTLAAVNGGLIMMQLKIVGGVIWRRHRINVLCMHACSAWINKTTEQLQKHNSCCLPSRSGGPPQLVARKRSKVRDGPSPCFPLAWSGVWGSDEHVSNIMHASPIAVFVRSAGGPDKGEPSLIRWYGSWVPSMYVCGGGRGRPVPRTCPSHAPGRALRRRRVQMLSMAYPTWPQSAGTD